MQDSEDFVVVIRAAGERTADACAAIVASQLIDPTRVCVLNLVPFEAALRRCYELGIASGKKWLLTLDADVLLREDAIRQLVAEAEAMPGHYLQLEGRVHDKLTGLYRQAGHRIYRVSLLQKALRYVPGNGEEVRPEYCVIQRMCSAGHPYRHVDLVVGLHDYKQFYRDVYRKAFLHASKHQKWVTLFVKRWQMLGPSDADYRVALRGLCDGLTSANIAKTDCHAYVDLARAALAGLGINEKPEIESSAIGFNYICSALEEAGPAPSVDAAPVAQRSSGAGAVAAPSSVGSWLFTHRKRIGWTRLVPYAAGAALVQFGEKLKRMADTGPI